MLRHFRGNVGIGKSISANIRIIQMLRIFRVNTSSAYISVSIFAQQGPLSVQSHMILYSFESYKSEFRLTFVSGIARRASKVASRQTKAERYM